MIVSDAPEVIHTLPKAYSTELDVASLTEIKMGFNVDLDTNSLEGNIVVFDENHNLVEGKIVYANRILTFTFEEQLMTGHTYRVLVRGDSEAYVNQTQATKGIQSVFGVAMPKDFDYTLSTLEINIPIPKIKEPSNYSSVDTTKPTFKWTGIKDSEEYELEVSKSNRFVPLLFPEAGLQAIYTSVNEFTWMTDMADGTYYARVRAGVGDYWSAWSEPIQFNIDTLEEGVVSEDDENLYDEPVQDDEPIEEFESMVEIVDVYPQPLTSQVSLKTPGIAVRILGDVSPSDINIKVIGAPIEEEDEMGFYEEVNGSVSLTRNPDGTTWAIFKPTIEDGDV